MQPDHRPRQTTLTRTQLENLNDLSEPPGTLLSVPPSGILAHVAAPFRSLHDTLVVRPLLRLYLMGPRLYGWGFWAGAPAIDICASLSNVPGDFWSDHPQECAMLITREFTATLVAFETFVYFLCLAYAAVLVLRSLGACLPCRRPGGGA